jgi:hypothetical protein
VFRFERPLLRHADIGRLILRQFRQLGIELRQMQARDLFIQVLAQIELWTKAGSYKNEVYVLPKHLDEKVARLHLGKLGANLTELSSEQAAYIGVTPKGPFKPEHYRY